jgi:hypothetical protein
MDRFVQRREQEDEDSAVQHQRWNHPPATDSSAQDRTGCDKCRCMTCKMSQAASVGANIQPGKPRTIDPTVVVDDLVHIRL